MVRSFFFVTALLAAALGVALVVETEIFLIFVNEHIYFPDTVLGAILTVIVVLAIWGLAQKQHYLLKAAMLTFWSASLAYAASVCAEPSWIYELESETHVALMSCFLLLNATIIMSRVLKESRA